MDFTNLDEVIKLLSKRFNLIFVDNAIYICDKKYANTTISYIKKLLKNNNVTGVSATPIAELPALNDENQMKM